MALHLFFFVVPSVVGSTVGSEVVSDVAASTFFVPIMNKLKPAVFV